MAIELYDLESLNSIGNAAVKTNIPELDPTVPGSFIRTMVDANSILIFAAQRNITAAMKDFFPQTASGEFLDFWAEINGLTRVPGTVSEGKVNLIGTLATSIPAGTTFANTALDNYVSTTTVTITSHAGSITLSRVATLVTAVTAVPHNLVSGSLAIISGAVDPAYNVTSPKASVTVIDENTFTYTVSSTPTAATDSGAYSSDFANIPVESVAIEDDMNLSPGAVLTLQDTVPGIDAGTQATVSGDGLTAGSDIEGDDSLRERVLLANAIDPGVFTTSQIRLDALTIPTASRVFVTNPSIDYTTDGTDVVGRVPDGFSESGGTATVDMTANGSDNIYVGSHITVAGVTPSDYNGDYTVLTVPDAFTFTYAVTGSPANSSVHGTVSLDKRKNIPIPGLVFVFVLDDDNDPPDPSTATLTNIKDAILVDLPAHATEDSVSVTGPIFPEVAVTISSLAPNTAGMRNALAASLNAFFQDSAEFAEDIKVNQIIAAIQNTQDLETGQFVTDFSLDLPTADVTVGNGSIGVLGTLTIA